MNTDVFTNIVQLALTCGIGVVAFFLKRTISELDECKRNITEIKSRYALSSELEDCKRTLQKLKRIT